MSPGYCIQSVVDGRERLVAVVTRPRVAGEEVALIPSMPCSLVSIRASVESERERAASELRRVGLKAIPFHYRHDEFFCLVMGVDEAWVRRRLDGSGLGWDCYSGDKLLPMLQIIFKDSVGRISQKVLAELLGASLAELAVTAIASPADQAVAKSEVDDVPSALTSAQKKSVIDALAAGYPTYDHLRYLFSTELDRDLEFHAPPGPIPHVLDRIVKEAEAQGWVDALLEGAARGNPGNPLLRRLWDSWTDKS